jgi:hypothetical protein
MKDGTASFTFDDLDVPTTKLVSVHA